MNPLVQKRSHKAGLPPGTLLHIGERRMERVEVTVFDYDVKECREYKVTTAEECRRWIQGESITWIDVEGLHDTVLLERLGAIAAIHPLTLEDILNTDQRPKVDDMEGYVYVVLKMLDYNQDDDTITAEQVSLLLGPGYVISFQEGRQGDVFHGVRERIRSGKGRIRRMGADYLAYALIDSIVDRYFFILERVGERIEALEDEIMESPGDSGVVQTLHHLKRQMLNLRKAVWPLREVLSGLEKSESDLLAEGTGIFLRDVYDHTIQIIDSIETFREMLCGLLDVYLSTLSHRMNSVMKVLTIIATIFIPLTFIVGVYGMNFHFMPELGWRWGYAVVWAIMLSTALGMVLYFKRKNWW